MTMPQPFSHVLPDIILTRHDVDRLTALLHHRDAAHPYIVQQLDEELARAHIVPSELVPADVVTMNSRVRFEDLTAGTTREITLVFPEDASTPEGRVSVLSPLGSALLGLRVGESIAWPWPSGRLRRYRVVEITYQPEAAGHYHL